MNQRTFRFSTTVSLWLLAAGMLALTLNPRIASGQPFPLCGNVYDTECAGTTCRLDSACVELWDSYPDGVVLQTDSTDSDGAFCLPATEGNTYDIRVYKAGYCTDVFEDVVNVGQDHFLGLDGFGFKLPESPFFHDFWSINATGNGYPVLRGDVIYACGSDGVVIGLAYVKNPGEYLIHVSGNVPKLPPDLVDEGADPGEIVSLWLNCECPLEAPAGFVNFGNTMFDANWACAGCSDETPPIVVCAPDSTMECPPACGPGKGLITCNFRPVDTAYDDGGGQVDVFTNYMYNYDSCGIYLEVDVWGVDSCGNISDTCQWTLFVNDATDPVITCPQAVAVQCVEDVPSPNPNSVIAFDNCGPVTVTHRGDSPLSGSCPGTIIRTYRATDGCDNFTECTQTITVDDTVVPICQLPSNQQVTNCVDQICLPVTATDNCDDAVTCAVIAGPGSISNGRWCYTPTESGNVTVRVRCTDDCDNTCEGEFTLDIRCEEPPEDEFCTLTQGAYGNRNGRFQGMRRLELIQSLLGSPLMIGKSGRSLTFGHEDAACIIARLPAGGTPSALPVGLGNATINHATCQSTPAMETNKNGQFKNVLIGQTITLSLNVRLSVGLGSFALCQRGGGCDTPDGIFSALATLGLPQTVSGLLELANCALAGQSAGGATHSLINDAVTGINECFDECREVVPCTDDSKRAKTVSAAGHNPDANAAPAVTLGQNHPNPFNPSTVISYSLGAPAFVRLRVYNVLGQHVETLIDGSRGAGDHDVIWNGTSSSGAHVASGIYFYRLEAGGSVVSRQMVLLR